MCMCVHVPTPYKRTQVQTSLLSVQEFYFQLSLLIGIVSVCLMEYSEYYVLLFCPPSSRFCSVVRRTDCPVNIFFADIPSWCSTGIHIIRMTMVTAMTTVMVNSKQKKKGLTVVLSVVAIVLTLLTQFHSDHIAIQQVLNTYSSGADVIIQHQNQTITADDVVVDLPHKNTTTTIITTTHNASSFQNSHNNSSNSSSNKNNNNLYNSSTKMMKTSSTATTTSAGNNASSAISIVAPSSLTSSSISSCEMVADKQATRQLLEQAMLQHKNNKNNNTTRRILLSPPFLNVGFPKMGSSTLHQFFICGGIPSFHWRGCTAQNSTGDCGRCMSEAYQSNHPLLQSCNPYNFTTSKDFTTNPIAFTQMDVESRGACFFPQMSALYEIHKEVPNATFLLISRPLDDWIESTFGWTGGVRPMQKRIVACNIPGLPVGIGTHPNELKQWVCNHQRNIRNFVAQYPSHSLVELDLYDMDNNAKILSQLFGIQMKCFGHFNNMKKKSKNK